MWITARAALAGCGGREMMIICQKHNRQCEPSHYTCLECHNVPEKIILVTWKGENIYFEREQPSQAAEKQ